MVEKRKKNLNKYGRNNPILFESVKKLALGDIEGLDMKKLIGEKYHYRCRVGKLRIIVKKVGDVFEIINIGTRGDVYK